MGLAIEIDVSLTPSRSDDLVVAAPYGAKQALLKYLGGIVLLSNQTDYGAECIGSAVLQSVEPNEFVSDNELITVNQVRWLANPKPFVKMRPKQRRPWFTVPDVEFSLLLGLFKDHNSWAAAPPLLPIEKEFPDRLTQEVLRTANGRCQFTQAVATPDNPIVAVPIRKISEGGLSDPGNFLSIQKLLVAPFSTYQLSVGRDRRMVISISRLAVPMGRQLNANGYLSMPNDTYRDAMEANLAWHFEQFIAALRWPPYPR